MRKTILKDEVGRRQIDAMARVFEKSNRVMSGKTIYVSVVDEPTNNAPSWTDGRTISFNQSVIGDVTSVEDIIRLTGLDLHELAHVFYTPRDGWLVGKVRRGGMHEAMNMLEDQRIETLLTAKYPSAVAYLVSTVMRFCLSHPQSWESNFPIIHGRYYLPKDIRDEFVRRFARQDLVAQFIDIIDEYRKMVLPLDENRAYELISDYNDLLNDMAGRGLTPDDPYGHTCGGRVEIDIDRPVSQQEQQDAADLSDVYDDAYNGVDEDEDDADSDPATGSTQNDAADPSTNADADPEDGDADGEGGDDDADGNGSGDGEGSDGDADGEGEGDSGLTGHGDGIGTTPAGQPPKYDDTEMAELLEEYAKAYEQQDDVQEDARNKQRAIVRGDGEITTHLPEGAYGTKAVKEDDLRAVRAFSKELEVLRADSDPGWATHRASGRINVRRAANGAPLTELWDEWDAGHNDACDIECVVLIDDSGSMSGDEIKQASRAMWIIKRAMERVDASVTVLTFGEESHIVYGRQERAGKSSYKDISANGSCTQPREAIIQAVRILTSTRRTNRIFIAITDGEWNSNSRGDAVSSLTDDQLIKAMGSQGVTTALCHLGRYSKKTHECQVSATVTHGGDLTAFAKSIVEQSIIQKSKGR